MTVLATRTWWFEICSLEYSYKPLLALLAVSSMLLPWKAVKRASTSTLTVHVYDTKEGSVYRNRQREVKAIACANSY